MTLGTLTDRTFDAVLFDNDGTLIDSTPAVRRSWAQWAVEHGVAPQAVRQFHGVTAASIIEQVAPDVDHAAALQRITELETADLADVVALPGAAEALRQLGERAAIATSATEGLAVARLRAAGLALPTVLVSADEVTKGKPDPEPYLLAARRLGADPARCLVVEDAPSGLDSARAAGCATLAVTTTTPRCELEADAVIATLPDVRWVVTAAGVQVQAR